MTQPKNEIALRVEDLHKAFGEKIVHRGVSFDLHRGEILALFGGSGTGKSVVLRSIIGLEKPDSGHIFYEDQDIVPMSERRLIEIRKRIAYVFQNGALFTRSPSRKIFPTHSVSTPS